LKINSDNKFPFQRKEKKNSIDTFKINDFLHWRHAKIKENEDNKLNTTQNDSNFMANNLNITRKNIFGDNNKNLVNCNFNKVERANVSSLSNETNNPNKINLNKNNINISNNPFFNMKNSFMNNNKKK